MLMPKEDAGVMHCRLCPHTATTNAANKLIYTLHKTEAKAPRYL